MSRRRFPVVATLATAVAMALLLGLGVWQVERLHWKEGLLAQIAGRRAAAPQPIGKVIGRAGDLEFTRVTAVCPGLASAPYVELYSLLGGKPGSRLVSACPIGGGSILVDRGFVDESVSARPAVTPDPTPVTVTGVLRKGGRPSLFTPAARGGRWFVRDIPAMAAALEAPRPAPYMIAAETSSNPAWKALVPAPVPADIPNNHLGYAITWFGLAGALLAVYIAMLLGRRRADSR
jgi:surfeit locus 1 family protein